MRTEKGKAKEKNKIGKINESKITPIQIDQDAALKEIEKHKNVLQPIKEWKIALMEEVNFLKRQGGSLYTVVNGRFLYNDKGYSVYVFTLISEVFFPDGTPVRIESGNKNALGEVLSVEGFEIELRLEHHIGNDIKEAKMYSEPWQLLVELSNRMEDIKNFHLKRGRVNALLKGTASAKHEDKVKNKKRI